MNDSMILPPLFPWPTSNQVIKLRLGFRQISIFAWLLYPSYSTSPLFLWSPEIPSLSNSLAQESMSGALLLENLT